MNSWPSCWMVWSICRPAAKDVGSALRRGPASSSANSRLFTSHMPCQCHVKMMRTRIQRTLSKVVVNHVSM